MYSTAFFGLGSAGCQPAVLGGLPSTPRMTSGKDVLVALRTVGKVPTIAGQRPALPGNNRTRVS